MKLDKKQFSKMISNLPAGAELLDVLLAPEASNANKQYDNRYRLIYNWKDEKCSSVFSSQRTGKEVEAELNPHELEILNRFNK